MCCRRCPRPAARPVSSCPVSEAHPGHLAAFAQSGIAQRSLRGMGEELRGLRANGEEFPIEASISRVNVNGRLLLTVILRDISERKAADEALRASDAFSNAIFDFLSSHVCVLDRHGVILKVNEAWTEFAGHNSDRAVAKADVGDNYLDICRKAIAGGNPTVAEICAVLNRFWRDPDPTFQRNMPSFADGTTLVRHAREGAERLRRGRHFACGYFRTCANGPGPGRPCGAARQTAS